MAATTFGKAQKSIFELERLLNNAFSASSGHDHDGSNSKAVSLTDFTFPAALSSEHIVDAASASGAGAVKATLDTGVVGDNNAITWTAKDYGDAYNGISLTLVDPGSKNQNLAVTVVGNDISVALATDNDVRATVSTAIPGDNNDLTFSAVAADATGNGITVEYVDPQLVSQALACTVVDSAITVSLATDETGAITTIASAVKTIIDNTPAAAALITVALKAGNSGATVVEAMAPVTTAGGVTGGTITTTASALITGIANTAAAAALISGANKSTSNGTGVVTALTATNLTGGTDAKSITGTEFNNLVTKFNTLLAACEKAGFVASS